MKYLFRFQLDWRVRASTYNLAAYYDVYSIPNDSKNVLVKWTHGFEVFEVTYTVEEMDYNLKHEVWVKI